jgi:hypothetical protein
MKRRAVNWVLRMANTSRKVKMISRTAQVNAVMTSENKKGQ